MAPVLPGSERTGCRARDALHWCVMKALALVVFIPLQLLVSKRLGVSQTGIDVMSGRWTMHVFGMREDEATVRMARVLPNYSPAGMWMALFPL